MLKYFVYIYIFSLLLEHVCARAGRRKGTPRLDLLEEAWTGKWFPYDPSEKASTKHELSSHTCDYRNNNEIGIDFDPANKTHSYNYLCLDNRTIYTPSMQRVAVLTEHFIPPAYEAPVKCLNESITYEEEIPTFGPHRLFAPKYGEYTFLPPQRWLQSLANGAIVMLYHPCAFPSQITVLKNILNSCLYRHIITPSQQLSPERPIALLAWGKLLQMSVVDDHIVVKFIKENAKQGPNCNQNEVLPPHLYDAGLLSEARLVTDEADSEVCGYKAITHD